MYYLSDRSYVYRFLGDKDIIYKIEIYNPDGSDAGVSYLEYNPNSNIYYHLPSMNGVGIEIFSEINDPAPQELKRVISYTAEMSGNKRTFLLSIKVTYCSGTTYEEIKTDKYPIGFFNSEEGLLSPAPNYRESAAWKNHLYETWQYIAAPIFICFFGSLYLNFSKAAKDDEKYGTMK